MRSPVPDDGLVLDQSTRIGLTAAPAAAPAARGRHRPGLRRDPSRRRRGPFAHPDEPVPAGHGADRGAGHRSLVAHLHHELRAAPVTTTSAVGGPCVLEHVRQPFLDDPVDGDREAGIQLVRWHGALVAHVQPESAHVVDQRGDDPRCPRVARRIAGVATQHAEHAPDLAERPPGRVGDRPGRTARPRRVPDVPRPVGLRDHAGERVRDDVVHVPGDAAPFARTASRSLLRPSRPPAGRARSASGLDRSRGRSAGPDRPRRDDRAGQERPDQHVRAGRRDAAAAS